jgi:hypothetical protein
MACASFKRGFAAFASSWNMLGLAREADLSE